MTPAVEPAADVPVIEAAAVAEVVPAPLAVELVVGEALVRQSSGRHRVQGAVGLSLAVPVSGRWGLAVEAMGSTGAERSDEIALDQHLVRPAVLATLTFARPTSTYTVQRKKRGPIERTTAWLGFDAGIGPAATFTFADWREPDLGTVFLVEPGVRGRTGFTFGVGEHVRVRLQGGVAWRPTGFDHDYTLGAAWAF